MVKLVTVPFKMYKIRFWDLFVVTLQLNTSWEIFLNLGCISLYKIVLNQLILLYLFIHTKHTAFFSYHQQKPGVTRKVPKIFPPFLVNKREWHLVNPQ